MASLTINNRPVEVRMEPDVPLLWALRDAAGLTGTKYGCGNGDCGACTVIVDGAAQHSCQITLGESEGRAVTTIEGLEPPGRHPVQQAFLAEQAFQCGFCTPGLVMATVALLQSNAEPSDEDIKAALTNLCRCGVYPRLIPAVRRAARALRAANPPPPVAPVESPPAANGEEAAPVAAATTPPP